MLQHRVAWRVQPEHNVFYFVLVLNARNVNLRMLKNTVTHFTTYDVNTTFAMIHQQIQRNLSDI